MRGGFHVEGLLFELRALGIELFAALQEFERFLAQGCVARRAGPEFGELLLMEGEFGVEFGEFDVKGFDVGVDLEGGG